MAADNIDDLISSLTPTEQQAVREFIRFLKYKEKPASQFLAAVDEFIEQHPDLLRRLAQ